MFKKSKSCANANMAVGYWTSNIVRQRKTKIVKYLSSLKTRAVTQNKITKKILIPWLLFHWPILSMTFENRVFFQCQSGEKCGKRLGENENLSFWHLALSGEPGWPGFLFNSPITNDVFVSYRYLTGWQENVKDKMISPWWMLDITQQSACSL